MKQNRRTYWFYVSTVVLCALLGGVYGSRVEATTNSGESDIQSYYKEFADVYGVVQQNYADPVDPDKALYGSNNANIGAIPGALRTLDPHSNFFDPKAFAQLREDQEGHYSGVGMQIQARPGKMGKLQTVVVLPMPGSPAFRAGLRPGDVIAKVDGKSCDGLNTSQVAEMLKGPKGTTVHVSVSREGNDELLEFTIVREDISHRSVDSAFMVRPGIAYIHISNFTETTNDELTEALKKLNEPDLQGLILDLRGNPGGLLQEAVDVSDHFLARNQLIVSHTGRRSPEKRYYAVRGEDGPPYPIVVLINRMTASAAEIVTGALQDHDRALVIGEPSFGKGLVQTVFQLSEKTGLALTTAHYYTPSGRLIQRDYSHVSLYDYYYHPVDTPTPHTEVRLTDGGREMYGGGGIAPDVRVEDPKNNSVQDALLQHSAFFNFGKYYLGSHKTIPKDFEVTDPVLVDFREFLDHEKIAVTDSDIQANADWIKSHIKVQLVASIFGEDEANAISIGHDFVVQKAIEDLPQARALLENAKKYMASKQKE
jgi:carboxyl-terminal processing protease